MRNRTLPFFVCLIGLTIFCLTADAQIGGGGFGESETIPVFATNNSGFVQTGVNGPDNLVLIDFPICAPEDPENLPEVSFTIVGNLESDFDADGNGAPDSLGSFSGLEWSTGFPGVGTLIGCVLNEGNGNGEFYQIDPLTADTVLIGQAPMVDGEQADFSDLAFNINDGLMYGLMNDISDDNNGNLDFGPNSIWVDTDGDLVPDTKQSDGTIDLRTDPLCFGQLATLASGMTFAGGALYVYDNMDEALLMGGLDSSTQNSSPCVVAFDENQTDLENAETAQGNGLGVVTGMLLLSTDVRNGNGPRNTVVSFYELPEPLQMEPSVVTPSGMFPLEFFQTGFQANVAIGDLVGAAANLNNLPPTFPDALIVNRGIASKDSVLEGVIASDDFRYCITSQPPIPTAAPVDITVIFTIPEGASATLLGLEVESGANTPNVQHTFAVLNVHTQQFESLPGSANLPTNSDGDVEVDMSLRISDFVDPATSQLIVRIVSSPRGPTAIFPWQVKFDSIIAVSE